MHTSTDEIRIFPPEGRVEVTWEAFVRVLEETPHDRAVWAWCQVPCWYVGRDMTYAIMVPRLHTRGKRAKAEFANLV
jgi:hypothetical protein